MKGLGHCPGQSRPAIAAIREPVLHRQSHQAAKVTQKQAQEPRRWQRVRHRTLGDVLQSPEVPTPEPKRGADRRLFGASRRLKRAVPPPAQRGPSLLETPRGKNAGKKGGKSTWFLYCSAGLCSVSCSASTLCIFRQGKPLVISLPS